MATNEDGQFRSFPKIPRFSRKTIITEKIDGTNALIYISKDLEFKVGSRSRWLSKESDNYGFFSWAEENKEKLLGLGPGYHYGEWWGRGIQRNYGLDHKKFSLFNVTRWGELGDEHAKLPDCCSTVPVLWSGDFEDVSTKIKECVELLKSSGSVAAPGFARPEGVVIYHVGGDILFKKTIEHDEIPKELIKTKTK